jgi:hypothetical protein
MKNFLKISALAAVLVASATFASADTIQLGSFSTTSGNNLGNANSALTYTGYVVGINTGPATVSAPTNAFVAPTYTLNPGTVWIAPLTNSTYVGSTAASGPVGTVNPAFGYYTYTTTFLASGLYGGTISILADDTTAVFLNGVQVVPFGALGGNSKCADGTPNCTVLSTYSFGGQLSGTNSLQFVVRQAGDGAVGADPSGLDFNATLTSVPEPNTLLMLGTGLMGSAGMLFRRMRS